MPGEKTSPTQPFPTKPPAYDRQGFSIDDLIDFTPELQARGGEDRLEIQDRADLHAAGGEQARRPARHAGDGRRWRRHQLGRRILRSGDPHRCTSSRNASPAHWAWLPPDAEPSPTWPTFTGNAAPQDARVRRELSAAARARVLVSRFRACRW